MPTVFTHPAVPLAIGLGLGRDIIPPGLLLAGVAGSILPDLDVIAFRFGIPYASPFGHRGFAHSAVFALAMAALGTAFARTLHSTPLTTFLFLFASVLSHGLLDCFTNGGLGIAIFWPFSSERYFAPVQPIEVSPIGMGFFSRRGLSVLASEFCFVWVPCAVLAVLLGICFHHPPESAGGGARPT